MVLLVGSVALDEASALKLGALRASYPNNLISEKKGHPIGVEWHWDGGSTYFLYKVGEWKVRYQITVNYYGKFFSASRYSSKGRATKMWAIRLISSTSPDASPEKFGGLARLLDYGWKLAIPKADARRASDLNKWTKGFAFAVLIRLRAAALHEPHSVLPF